MIKVGKLILPDKIKAVLWDMDGVLIDSLGFDFVQVNKLLRKYFRISAGLSMKYLKFIFGYDPVIFWKKISQKISKATNSVISRKQLQLVRSQYASARLKQRYRTCPGIFKILKELNQLDIKQVVVSNNPKKDIKIILKRAGILGKLDLIVGNGGKQLAKKPAPDMYLLAAKNIRLISNECAVVEDTEIGIKAGQAAGCFVIGVATGGASKYQLNKMRPRPDKIYPSL